MYYHTCSNNDNERGEGFKKNYCGRKKINEINHLKRHFCHCYNIEYILNKEKLLLCFEPCIEFNLQGLVL